MINFGFNDGPEDFDNHVDNLRGTMFYVCQVKSKKISCLFALCPEALTLKSKADGALN